MAWQEISSALYSCKMLYSQLTLPQNRSDDNQMQDQALRRQWPLSVCPTGNQSEEVGLVLRRLFIQCLVVNTRPLLAPFLGKNRTGAPQGGELGRINPCERRSLI